MHRHVDTLVNSEKDFLDDQIQAKAPSRAHSANGLVPCRLIRPLKLHRAHVIIKTCCNNEDGGGGGQGGGVKSSTNSRNNQVSMPTMPTTSPPAPVPPPTN